MMYHPYLAICNFGTGAEEDRHSRGAANRNSFSGLLCPVVFRGSYS